LGWNKPLKIKIDWNASKLKSELTKHIGEGKLARSMNIRERKDGLRITSDKPYAEIQDVGGVIPPLQTEGVMRFQVAGQVVFARSRGAITIKPKHYTEQAVDSWYRSIKIEWV